LAFVEPMGNSVSTSNWRGDVSFDMGVGVSLQAEYRVSPRIGVEIGVMGASGFGLSSSVSHGNVSGDIRLTGFAPLSLGLNVHLTPESTVDLYAGPQLALVAYGTNRTWWDSWSGGVELSAKNDWAWGLVAGLDVPLGKRGWLFNANLRYLDTSIEQSGGGFHFDGDFDPLIFSLGFGYAF
ncbi:MAG: OmpW family outer membrane protein, partial [Lysobacterales bacterium]